MPNWLAITTNFKDPDGSAYDGTLYATVPTRLLMPDGEIVMPARMAFPVVAGVAKKPDGSTAAELPVTEDANPGGTTIGLALVDTQGRKLVVGEIAVPRTAAASVALVDLLPVGEG